jgi:hypothetical protein
MVMTTVSNIKRIEGECTKLCEESTQVWKKLVEDPEMKAIEAKLREVQGTCTTSVRKGYYTSTSGTYDNHFGSEEVICRSGENEGSTKYPSTMIGTTTGRSK